MSAVCCDVEGEGPGETVGGAVQPPCVHPYTCTCALVRRCGWMVCRSCAVIQTCLSVCLSVCMYVCLLLAQFPLHYPSYVYYLCFFFRSRPFLLPGALLYPSLSVLHNGSLVLFGGRTSPAAANDKAYLLRPASATAGVCGVCGTSVCLHVHMPDKGHRTPDGCYSCSQQHTPHWSRASSFLTALTANEPHTRCGTSLLQ